MAQPSDTSYRLVFADEFNGTSVDTTKWNIASPSWTMPNSLSGASASEVSVANGGLTLAATRPSSTGTFNSGSVSTYGLYSFSGGYVEARIQLPTTPGSWPAFWGLYTGWPPEADIMEYPLTTDGGTDGFPNNAYNTNFHYTNSSGVAEAGAGEVTTSENLGTTGYHIFAMDWTAGTSVTFYLDGTAVSSFTNSAVSQMVNMYLILDYAVGGWPGTPSTTQWPAGWTDQMQVDWVHVWQKNPNGDTSSSWKINGGGAFATSGNWSNGIVPSFGNQTATFGPVGNAATASISMPNWAVFGDITFGGGATAYTIGSASNLIQLAGQPLGSSPVGSTVLASSSSTASQNVNARVELWNSTTFDNAMTGGQTLNFNSAVTGTTPLSVTGPGATVLSASNSYSGGTDIGLSQEAAVLRASANNALGSGSVVIGPGGNATTADLQLSGTCAQTNGIDFRGRNNSSAGIENLNGNNMLAGAISADIGGGTYQIQSDAGALTLSGNLQAVSGSRTFTLQGVGNGFVSGQVLNGGGTASIYKDGAGTWALTGSNTYTGTTTVNAGTLELAPACVARYTFDNISGNTVFNDGNGGSAMNGTLANGATIVSGGRFGNAVSLSGGASLNINNPIVDMGSTSQWTVSTWVKTTTAGSTIFSKSNGTGWTSGNTVFYLGDGSAGGSGGIPSGVRYAGGFFQGSTSARSVDDGNWHMVTYVNSGGTCAIYVDGAAQSLSSGNSGFSNADVGTVVRLGFTTDNASGDGTVNYNGLLDDVQFYSQALSTAQIAALYQGKIMGGSLPSTANITINAGGTLEVNGVNQTLRSLSGGGALVQTGAGTLILTGSNTYTGPTTISAGTLDLLGSLSGTSAITVAGGATLSGTGLIAGSLSLAGNAIHAPGVQTIGGALSYGAGAQLEWTLNSNTAGAASQVSAGAVNVTTGADIDLVLNGTGSTVNFSNGFWSQPETWTVLSGTSITGAFSLGTISADSASQPASNYGIFSLQQSGTAVAVTFTPYTPWQDWQRTNFGANWNNAAVSGETVITAGDGLSNLAKYAMGLSPYAPSASSAPQAALIGGKLTITFARNTAATDTTMSVLAADSPAGPWTVIASSTAGGPFAVNVSGATASEAGTGTIRTVQVGDIYTISDPAHPHRFLQLQVQD